MKHICKKAVSLFAVWMILLSVTGTVVSATAQTAPQDMEKQAKEAAASLINEVVNLSDDDIASIRENGNDFAKQVVDVWETKKEELGAFDSILDDESTVESDVEGVYTTSMMVKFEKQKAKITMPFEIVSGTLTPTSFSLDIEYPKSTLLRQAGLNTLMGVLIVFAMLAVLSLLISLFRFIGRASSGKKKAPAAVPAPVQQPDTALKSDDKELAAVIAAAIAASEGTSTDDFVVRSIRRVNKYRG